MSTSRHPGPDQLSFLDMVGTRPVGGADLAWGQRMRALMAQAIKSSGLSRDQVADRTH